MGKTALAVNFALAAGRAGHTVGLISGEQSAKQIGQRSLAIDAEVRAELMRNGQIEDSVWSLLNQAAKRLGQHRIRIYDRPAPTLDEVVRTARWWKQEFGMGLLLVDYLQRIRVPGIRERKDEVAEVAIGLKTLARDLDLSIVCLAQVKAEVEQRTEKRPRQGDIANSDEATREADQIAFLYRDEVYNDDTEDKGVAELNVEKNRHGATGQFRIGFDAESMRFHNLDEGAEQHRMNYTRQPAAPRRARAVPTEPKRGSRAPKYAPRDEAAAARVEDVTGGAR
jgi:replicative DNA helicase